MAGDEGGPVLDSLDLEEASISTAYVTEKVGHKLGEETITVTDVVLSESHDEEKGAHPPFGESCTKGEKTHWDVGETIEHHEKSAEKPFTALTEDGSREDDREGRKHSMEYSGKKT